MRSSSTSLYFTFAKQALRSGLKSLAGLSLAIALSASNTASAQGVTPTATPACPPDTFKAMLTGAQEVPPNNSTATGSGTVVLSRDPGGATISVDVTFTGLAANASAAHIHGPAMPGVPAPIIIPFPNFPASTSGTYTNTFPITPEQVEQLANGLLYINIHNTPFPTGEIRGQLLGCGPAPSPTGTPPNATVTPTATPTEAPTVTPTPGGSATPGPTGTPVGSPTPTFEGNFVIGDLNAVVGNHVTFFGRHWAEFNSLSGGPAPEGFKGFARHPDPNPAQCGGTWTSSSDSHPPEHVPRLITAIASSSITESESGSTTFMGDIPILVLIATDCRNDDAPNSDEDDSRTGVVVAVICGTGPTPTPGGSATPSPTGTPVVTPTPTFEGNFVIGDLNAAVGNHVTFFSRHWAEFNSLSGGSAPEGFKGFARHPDPNPAQCGGTWTSGSDSRPPEQVPRLIMAIASSSITESESGSTTFMGDIPMLVVIATDIHDAPNSDDNESRTGTVIAVICSTGPTPTPGATATPMPTEGNFVIGDLNAVVGNHVTFFGRHWAESNSLSGGPGPEGFKGFARHPDPNPAQCGGTWTSSSDSHPPGHVPTLITAIASSSITGSESASTTFMGDIPMLVLIVTDCHNDDGPNSDEDNSRTGTVVAVICSPGPLTNISTRIRVETGDNTLIGGFIIAGTDAKRVLLRACGPSLPLSDRLADPILELHDSSGQMIASNDNWVDAPNAQAIIDTTIPPSNNLEAAILTTLAPGSYTATVRGANNTTGIGLVEAYDLDRTANSRLANLSTRGQVQTSDNIMIAGMFVLGQRPRHVIVRAIGPSLDLPGKLADPILELRDANGGLIRSNDNWRSDQEAEIRATTLPPSNDLESAIVVTLPANGASYTAIVRGANGTTGVALVEVYGLD